MYCKKKIAKFIEKEFNIESITCDSYKSLEESLTNAIKESRYPIYEMTKETEEDIQYLEFNLSENMSNIWFASIACFFAVFAIIQDYTKYDLYFIKTITIFSMVAIGSVFILNWLRNKGRANDLIYLKFKLNCLKKINIKKVKVKYVTRYHCSCRGDLEK